MSDKWEPTVRPIIVCAGNINALGQLVIGPRHWDSTMRRQVELMRLNKADERMWYRAEQGFIDQFGRFHNREDAMLIARSNKQIRFPDDMLSQTSLHSEDLY